MHWEFVWVCSNCYVENNNDRTSCKNCHQEKPTKRQTVKEGTEKSRVAGSEKIRDAGSEKIRDVGSGKIRDAGAEKIRDVGSGKIRDAGAEKKIVMVQPSMSYGIDKKELRMVLIGKTGVGKSSTANTILGDKNAFEAKMSPKSVTEKCNFDRRERFERKILLVDTPGLFDTSTPKNIVENEIRKCIGISAPGPHAFLLVMSFTNRFTEEEKKVLMEVSNMFGDKMIEYLIVVFTGRDQIDKGSCIEKHIEEYPEEFRSLVMQAGGGYTTFNNRGSDSEKEEDVQGLLNRIDQMVNENGGGYFTSEMFEAAENVIQQRIANELAKKEDEIRKAVEDEIRQAVEEEMRAKFDDEKTRLNHFQGGLLQEYKVLGRELDKEHSKNRTAKQDISLRASLRPLVLKRMKRNTESMIISQIQKCNGAERAEAQKQLAAAGQEMQHLLQQTINEDIPQDDEEAEETNSDEDAPVEDEFQEHANEAMEAFAARMRDGERANMMNETGTFRQIKEKIRGAMSSFVNLFQ